MPTNGLASEPAPRAPLDAHRRRALAPRRRRPRVEAGVRRGVVGLTGGAEERADGGEGHLGGGRGERGAHAGGGAHGVKRVQLWGEGGTEGTGGLAQQERVTQHTAGT